MSLFLIIGIALGILVLLGVLYSLLTDPARIDEEEDAVVAQESPAERHGFLRSYTLSQAERDDRMAEDSKAGYTDESIEVNEL